MDPLLERPIVELISLLNPFGGRNHKENISLNQYVKLFKLTDYRVPDGFE